MLCVTSHFDDWCESDTAAGRPAARSSTVAGSGTVASCAARLAGSRGGRAGRRGEGAEVQKGRIAVQRWIGERGLGAYLIPSRSIRERIARNVIPSSFAAAVRL